MTYAIENVRFKELFVVTEQNKVFFDYFQNFVVENGFVDIHDFVTSSNHQVCLQLIYDFLDHSMPDGVELLDGIARPYRKDKAKWLFLGWLLRDAPEQRLRPMLKQMPGDSPIDRRANLINLVRLHVGSFLTSKDRWDWTAISEVMIDRLEGSRRAIKGTLFEAIVRRHLEDIFQRLGVSACVHANEARMDGETYDVVVSGSKSQILMPVKTRETMGGGHAVLFTRDIHKSISVASSNGYDCLPIVIAESWEGSLDELDCDDFIFIERNPNQVRIVEPLLLAELEKRISLFRRL